MQSDFRIAQEQQRRALARKLVKHFFATGDEQDEVAAAAAAAAAGGKAAKPNWQLLQAPPSKFEPVVEKVVLLCKHQETRRFEGGGAFEQLAGIREKLRANSLLKKAAAMGALVAFVREQRPRFTTEVNDNFVAEVLQTLLLLGGSPTRVSWDAAELLSSQIDIPGVQEPRGRDGADDGVDYDDGGDGASSGDDGGLRDWEEDFNDTSDEEEGAFF
jgi:hypothetical protein